MSFGIYIEFHYVQPRGESCGEYEYTDYKVPNVEF